MGLLNASAGPPLMLTSNWTEAMVPSLSLAAAVMFMAGPGALKTVPLIGDVMVTVGGLLTRNETAVDCVVKPTLSVATAVIWYVSAGTLAQV